MRRIKLSLDLQVSYSLSFWKRLGYRAMSAISPTWSSAVQKEIALQRDLKRRYAGVLISQRRWQNLDPPRSSHSVTLRFRGLQVGAELLSIGESFSGLAPNKFSRLFTRQPRLGPLDISLRSERTSPPSPGFIAAELQEMGLHPHEPKSFEHPPS